MGRQHLPVSAPGGRRGASPAGLLEEKETPGAEPSARGRQALLLRSEAGAPAGLLRHDFIPPHSSLEPHGGSAPPLRRPRRPHPYPAHKSPPTTVTSGLRRHAAGSWGSGDGNKPGGHFWVVPTKAASTQQGHQTSGMRTGGVPSGPGILPSPYSCRRASLAAACGRTSRPDRSCGSRAGPGSQHCRLSQTLGSPSEQALFSPQAWWPAG